MKKTILLLALTTAAISSCVVTPGYIQEQNEKSWEHYQKNWKKNEIRQAKAARKQAKEQKKAQKELERHLAKISKIKGKGCQK